MPEFSPEALEFQRRVNLIRESVAALHGDDAAFAAVSAAWLRMIQFAVKESMLRIVREKQLPHTLIDALDAEHELILRGFHEEICKQLGVSASEAIKLSKHFEQVVRDAKGG